MAEDSERPYRLLVWTTNAGVLAALDVIAQHLPIQMRIVDSFDAIAPLAEDGIFCYAPPYTDEAIDALYALAAGKKLICGFPARPYTPDSERIGGGLGAVDLRAEWAAFGNPINDDNIGWLILCMMRRIWRNDEAAQSWNYNAIASLFPPAPSRESASPRWWQFWKR